MAITCSCCLWGGTGRDGEAVAVLALPLCPRRLAATSSLATASSGSFIRVLLYLAGLFVDGEAKYWRRGGFFF